MSHRNDNLKIVFAGWVDALRRHDLAGIKRHLHPDVVWQGLRRDLICGDRAAVLDNVGQDQGWLPDVAGIELLPTGIRSFSAFAARTSSKSPAKPTMSRSTTSSRSPRG